MAIPTWTPLNEGEEPTKNMQKIALSLNGVIQHIFFAPVELASLLMETPTVTLLPIEDQSVVGQRLQ